MGVGMETACSCAQKHDPADGDAQVLVSNEGQAVFTINDIEDAVAQRARICIHFQALATAQGRYPGANLVAADLSGDIPGMIYEGKCDCAVMHKRALDSMYAGDYNTIDCERDAVACKLDSKKNPIRKRDCNIRLTGKMAIVKMLCKRSMYFQFLQSFNDRRQVPTTHDLPE